MASNISDEKGAVMPTESPKPSRETPFPIDASKLNRDGTVPELPPQMASVRTHTADEIVQMMKKTPLFMNSIEDGEAEDNIELEAIRALQYEGTPLENAENFREQGNDMVKAKQWKDGQEFYTKAIGLLQRSQRERPQRNSKDEDEDEEKDEASREEKLQTICFVNRALCNLELKNYRSTTMDCAQALRQDPRNVKAFYRSGLALLALDKVEEAADACQRGMAVEPSNNALKALSSRIQARRDTLFETETKRRKQAERDRQAKLTLTAALKARNIRLRKTHAAPDLEDASIHLEPDPLSAESTLQFPLVILYPVHAQTDFIKAVSETDTVVQHLDYIFPLPWDEKREYTVDSVDMYMDTVLGGLIKLGKKMSLLKVLSGNDVEVVDELVKVHVLPKSKAPGWIAELKARRGKLP